MIRLIPKVSKYRSPRVTRPKKNVVQKTSTMNMKRLRRHLFRAPK